MPLDEPHDMAPLPEVSEDSVVEAAEAVDPVFAANPTLKNATGWGEAMADQGNLNFYEPTTEEQVRLLQKVRCPPTAEEEESRTRGGGGHVICLFCARRQCGTCTGEGV